MLTIAGGILLACLALALLPIAAAIAAPIIGFAIVAWVVYLICTNLLATLTIVGILGSLIPIHFGVEWLRVRYWKWHDVRAPEWIRKSVAKRHALAIERIRDKY